MNGEHQFREPFVVFPLQNVNDPTPVTKVTKEGTCSFYGPFDVDTLSKRGTAFIEQHSDGDEAVVQKRLRAFLALAEEDCMKTGPSLSPSIGDTGSQHGAEGPNDSASRTNSCWLTIRICLPTDEYKVPRWHRDGRMFTCTCPENNEDGSHTGPNRAPHSKYAVALLGPGTRALKPSEEVDAYLDPMKWWRDELREGIAVNLAPFEEEFVATGQVIRFSWGEKDSPVHSEPDFSRSDRVFVSVLFGSEGEIRDMCRSRDEVYNKHT